MKCRMSVRHSPLRIASIALAGLAVAMTGTVVAQRGATSASTGAQSDVTTRIVASAQSLLKTLDDAGRAKVQYPFDSPQKGIGGPMMCGLTALAALAVLRMRSKQR